MSRHGYAKRKDANSGEIERALTAIGVGVLDTSPLAEFVDLVTFQRGRIRLIEVKDGSKPPSHRKLTLAQILLHDVARRHGCEIHVVTSVAEALALHGAH